MSISRHLTVVGAATAFSRLAGFVRDALLAALLGTSSIADIYVAAFLVPNLVRRMIGEGALNPAIVPRLARIEKQDGPPAARAYVDDLLSLLSVAAIVLVIVAELAMPAIMGGLAHGFAAEPEKSAHAILFGRIAFPFVGLMLVIALVSTLLNAAEHFLAPALAPVILNLALIMVLITLLVALPLGQFEAGLVLVSTVLVAGLVQLAVLWMAAIRAGLPLRARPFAVLRGRIGREAVTTLLMALPGMLVAGSGHVHLMIASLFASFEPRGVALLYFADRLFQLPLGFVAAAIGVVLLPRLARTFQQGDAAGMAAAQHESLAFSALIILPAATGLFVLAEPIIAVLFQRAAFTAADSAAVAANLRILALALPAFVLVKIAQPAFLARERLALPLAAAGAAFLVNAASVLLLWERLGNLAPVIGVAVGAWANAGMLILAGIGRFRPAREALLRLGGLALSALAMGVGIERLAGFAAPWLAPDIGFPLKAVVLAGLCLAGAGLFLALAIVFRAIDPGMLRARRHPDRAG